MKNWQKVGQRLAQLSLQSFMEIWGTQGWTSIPDKVIFKKALDNWLDIKPKHILCIGDSSAYDVTLGKALGFKVALVHTSIHNDLSCDDLF